MGCIFPSDTRVLRCWCRHPLVRRTTKQKTAISIGAGRGSWDAHAGFVCKVVSMQREADITVLHFNDAYHISEGTHEPIGGVARFKTAINDVANLLSYKPLITFGGDIFNPSLLSIVTKGTHMCDVMNKIGVEYAVIGNHDFDFGLEALYKLIENTNAKWLFSNVTLPSNDSDGDVAGHVTTQLPHTAPYHVFPWNGFKIGIIGLVEKEWLATLAIDERLLHYEDFIEVGTKLATYLKEEEGVQLLIALTHMRFPNDEKLAMSVPQIDLILGGHDHFQEIKITNGTVLAKNGADFHHLTRIDCWIDRNGEKPTMQASVIDITKQIKPDEDLQLFEEEYNRIMRKKMEVTIAVSDVQLDATSGTCRTKESNLGNYVTDIMRIETGAEIAILNGGTIRSDALYGPGNLTLGDLLKIFPFEDIIVVIEATGLQILGALENAVSQYPRQEGRFTQLSGLKLVFDHTRPTGNKVVKVEVESNGEFEPLDLDRVYKVATKTYLTEGKDGFNTFNDCKFVIPVEFGLLLSVMIRRYWLKLKVLKMLMAPNANAVTNAVDKFRRRGKQWKFLPKVQPRYEDRIVRLPRD